LIDERAESVAAALPAAFWRRQAPALNRSKDKCFQNNRNCARDSVCVKTDWFSYIYKITICGFDTVQND